VTCEEKKRRQKVYSCQKTFRSFGDKLSILKAAKIRRTAAAQGVYIRR
jgi:hypothetical protein